MTRSEVCCRDPRPDILHHRSACPSWGLSDSLKFHASLTSPRSAPAWSLPPSFRSCHRPGTPVRALPFCGASRNLHRPILLLLAARRPPLAPCPRLGPLHTPPAATMHTTPGSTALRGHHLSVLPHGALCLFTATAVPRHSDPLDCWTSRSSRRLHASLLTYSMAQPQSLVGASTTSLAAVPLFSAALCAHEA